MGRIKVFEENARRTRSVLATCGQYRNVLKCSKGKAEGVSCKILKFWLQCYCDEHELDYYTEATLRDVSGRIDFLIEQWCVAIEILGSEDWKRYSQKHYPLPTIPLPAETPVEEVLDMLDDLNATNGSGADYYINKYSQKIRERTPHTPIQSIRSVRFPSP